MCYAEVPPQNLEQMHESIGHKFSIRPLAKVC
jgi:hypothetical protein